MSPLHPGLVEGAQQAAAEQREGGRGQSQPLLRVDVRLGLSRGPVVLGGEDELLLVLLPGALLLSEVLAADVLEDGEAQRVEQEVPGLVLLLHEAAGRQAQGVAQRAGQEQDVQLRQRPLAVTAPGRRLWDEMTRK